MNSGADKFFLSLIENNSWCGSAIELDHGLCAEDLLEKAKRLMGLEMGRKPIGRKIYGHIPHIPGSRMGPGDHKCSPGLARIATLKKRDNHDMIFCQEKLDGSNVGVARVDGKMFPLVRHGYHALSSPFEQHHKFAAFAEKNRDRFMDHLKDGERICGEWLWQPHGTLYKLTHEPFVAFDIMTGSTRTPWLSVVSRLFEDFWLPFTISGPITVEDAMKVFGERGKHGAKEKIEGMVWRVERDDKVDFLCKFVFPDKVDGKYLRNRFPGDGRQ